MKKWVFLLVTTVLIASCTGIKSSTHGLENQGYIEIVKNSRYRQCTIEIDGNRTIKVKFDRSELASRPRGKRYAVSTGKHEVKIYFKGQLIYKKQIFIGNQETRNIILP